MTEKKSINICEYITLLRKEQEITLRNNPNILFHKIFDYKFIVLVIINDLLNPLFKLTDLCKIFDIDDEEMDLLIEYHSQKFITYILIDSSPHPETVPFFTREGVLYITNNYPNHPNKERFLSWFYVNPIYQPLAPKLPKSSTESYLPSKKGGRRLITSTLSM
jgi:hypothetical protein